MKPDWPRGSEWRKWDLHIHAPGTKLNDQFKPVNRHEDIWDQYCRKLDQSDVQVFGITDYFSADAYFMTKKHYKNLYPNSSKVLFCNIELRISESVNNKQEEVNLHLIFNTFHNDHEQKINWLLQKLKTNTTESTDREIVASELTTEAEFKAATTTRAFIRTALEDTYGRNTDITDYLLIATAANNDGIRPKRGIMRKQQIALEIDKFSHLFLGNSNNVDYFLNRNRRSQSANTLERKPVVSGCDAHSLVEIDEKLGRVKHGSNGVVFEPTWIKADPTYEGLKQIIFEPEDRVFIGKEPEIFHRVRHHKTKYIDALEVTNISEYSGQQGDWFRNETVVFGTELVSIIGNKGSGKSALTDVIGLLGNSHNQKLEGAHGRHEEMFSFLNRDKFLRKGLAKNFKAHMIWKDGVRNETTLDNDTNKQSPEQVEYLPQKYLERICANISDDEFRRKLNGVVFRYVPDPERYGHNSLDDLIAYLTQQSEAEIERSMRQVRQANESVVSIERKLKGDYRKKIEEKIRVKKQELEAHASTLPKERPKPVGGDSTGTTGRIEEINRQIAACSESMEQLKSEQAELLRRTEELGQVRQAISHETENLLSLKARFAEILESVQLSFDDIVKLNLDYSGIDQIISETKGRIAHNRALLATEEQILRTVADHSDPQASMLGREIRQCSM